MNHYHVAVGEKPVSNNPMAILFTSGLFQQVCECGATRQIYKYPGNVQVPHKGWG